MRVHLGLSRLADSSETGWKNIDFFHSLSENWTPLFLWGDSCFEVSPPPSELYNKPSAAAKGSLYNHCDCKLSFHLPPCSAHCAQESLPIGWGVACVCNPHLMPPNLSIVRGEGFPNDSRWLRMRAKADILLFLSTLSDRVQIKTSRKVWGKPNVATANIWWDQ